MKYFSSNLLHRCVIFQMNVAEIGGTFIAKNFIQIGQSHLQKAFRSALDSNIHQAKVNIVFEHLGSIIFIFAKEVNDKNRTSRILSRKIRVKSGQKMIWKQKFFHKEEGVNERKS